MTQRTERIDELLRQEIGQALEREVTDPRIGFVTITDVETSPDLAKARVWVSIIGTPEQRKESLAALRKAMPFVRHSVGQKIRIRRIPEFEVRLDDTAERGTRVMHILDELAAGHDAGDVQPLPESLPTPVKRIRIEGDADVEPDLTAAPASAPKRLPKARTNERRPKSSGPTGTREPRRKR